MLICFPHVSAHLEQIAADLSQSTSTREDWKNGYSDDQQEVPSANTYGSVVDPHRRLLMVLSNIGYCKDELASELYNKFKYTWLQSRLVFAYLTSLVLFIVILFSKWYSFMVK